MGFQQGLSGLSGAAKNLDVIGNNIANSTTVGFKSSVTQFADVYATSLTGTGGLQIGIGSQVAAVAQQFTQGSTSITNNPLDVAINGEGFFRLNNNGAITYGRNGQFQLDKDGYVVNNSGLRVTGYGLDASGNLAAATPADIQIPFADIAPYYTHNASLVANLDSQKTAMVATAINPANATTYHNSTSLTVYDEGGNDHGLVLYFQKTASNSWNVDGYVNGTQVDLNGAAAGSTMTMSFNSNGTINQINGVAAAAVSVTTPSAVLNTGAGALTFNLDMTDFTQYGSNFGVNSITQDGFSSGRIAGLAIANDGIIQGRYTNGQSKTLAQVTLANFVNPRGLQSMGNNQWAETSESGQPTIGSPGSGTLGIVQSGAVEDSNVDLTAELVNLIVAQRMYQANAQTVRAQDQILQTLINLR